MHFVRIKSAVGIRTAVLMFVGFLLSTCGFAQKNELSFTVGGLWSSDQTVESALKCPTPICNPSLSVTMDNGVAFEGDFVRRILSFPYVSLDMDIPLVGAPGRDIHFGGSPSGSPVSSLYFTPSGRVSFLHSKSISPFATVGGGLAHYSFQGEETTAGAFQFGGGLDFRTRFPHLGLKVEARDFYAVGAARSAPLAIVSPKRQHNVFAGGGVVLRF
jgi:hypothetical protein